MKTEDEHWSAIFIAIPSVLKTIVINIFADSFPHGSVSFFPRHADNALAPNNYGAPFGMQPTLKLQRRPERRDRPMTPSVDPDERGPGINPQSIEPYHRKPAGCRVKVALRARLRKDF